MATAGPGGTVCNVKRAGEVPAHVRDHHRGTHMNFLQKLREQDGATATEYIFLLVFIAIAIIVGATALGTAVNAGFSSASASVNNAVTSN